MGAALDLVPTMCRHTMNSIHVLFCILTLSLPGMELFLHCMNEEAAA